MSVDLNVMLSAYGVLDRTSSRILPHPIAIGGSVGSHHFVRTVRLKPIPLPRASVEAVVLGEGQDEGKALLAHVGELHAATLAEAEGALLAACRRAETFASQVAREFHADACRIAAETLAEGTHGLDHDVMRGRKRIIGHVRSHRVAQLKEEAPDIRIESNGKGLKLSTSRLAEIRIGGDEFVVEAVATISRNSVRRSLIRDSLPQFLSSIRDEFGRFLVHEERRWEDVATRLESAIRERAEDDYFDRGRLRSIVRDVFTAQRQTHPGKAFKRIRRQITELDRQADESRVERFHEERPDLVVYKDLFPVARRLRRRLVLYVGPTNSGKTHRALDHLVEAGSGVYLAPLRLLALEGQEKLLDRGVEASFLTGEERDIRPGAQFTASTIEMLDPRREVGAAVIDEVQLLADEYRGWAWTQALIGAPARTVVMTGSPDAEPLVRIIAEYLGEELEVHHLERYTPLEVNQRHTRVEDIQPGTAVIAFSRRDVLALKDILEPHHGRVAVIYGNLTPEVRREEARRFRTGEASILVATDAIAMGLNLPIRTVLFANTEKFNGKTMAPLTTREILQIGGRAGRFGMHERGYVGTIDPEDLWMIQHAFKPENTPEPLAPIVSVRPHVEHVEALAGGAGTRRLAEVLEVFRARMVFDDPMLTASVTDDLIALAKIVDQYPEVPLQERLRWAFAPVDPQNLRVSGCYSRWYQDYVRRRIIALPTEGMRFVEAGSARYDRDLYDAEIESKVLTVYSWLSFRFPEHFPAQAECTDLRAALNDYVERSLTAASRRADSRRKPRRRAQRA